jgi:hypothetical protein
MRNDINIELSIKPNWWRYLGRSRHAWAETNNVHLKEMEWKIVDQIHIAQDRI